MASWPLGVPLQAKLNRFNDPLVRAIFNLRFGRRLFLAVAFLFSFFLQKPLALLLLSLTQLQALLRLLLVQSLVLELLVAVFRLLRRLTLMSLLELAAFLLLLLEEPPLLVLVDLLHALLLQAPFRAGVRLRPVPIR
jgi:hypothetical protein